MKKNIETAVESYARRVEMAVKVVPELGGQPMSDFLKNYKEFTSLEHFMREMLYCRARMDEANMKDTDYEYLEATLQLIMCMRTRNFSANNKEIENAWRDVTQKLIEAEEKKAEKNSVPPNIRKEWLTIPEEYKFGAGEVLDYAFERAPQYKLEMFIALVNIFII